MTLRTHSTPRFLQYALYPALLATTLAVSVVARDAGLPPAVCIVLCTVLVGALAMALEQVIPYRRDWGVTWADLKADILHGVVSNGVPSAILENVLKAALLGFALSMKNNYGVDLWPDEWPLAAQVLLALFAAEVGFYTVHRLFHESGSMWLWRWHSVHHSSERMYFLAGSRTHPGQVIVSFGSTVAILWSLGAPAEVLFFKTVLHTGNGILQHANLDMRLGWLNWIIAGPELHRWHHSYEIAESNNNYGNNLSVLDVLFGTHFLPAGSPPVLGLQVPYRNTYVGHMLIPFERHQKPTAEDSANPPLELSEEGRA